MLFIKIPFLCTYPNYLGLKTKEEPKTNLETTKELQITKMCCLLRLPSLLLLLYLPLFYRPTTERTPREDRLNSLPPQKHFS